MKYKKIFSKAIAIELITKGFEVLKKEKNRYKPWLDVYIFENTEELLNTLTDLTQHTNI